MANRSRTSIAGVNTAYEYVLTLQEENAMATTTADPAAEPVDVAQAPVPDPRPKRKWRTFTMSEEAYDTLIATSEALGTNRSRLIEDLI